MERKNIWSTYTPEEITELDNISTRYKACLNEGKTERECVELGVRLAQEAGYRDLNDVMAEGGTLKTGDKVYAVCMSKMLALFRIGEEPVSAGMNILGAHIDSPRIDVKQNPLYENEGLAYLDTHYYGGIKKYQWVAQPLALHGVVVKKDGTVTKINIGEDRKPSGRASTGGASERRSDGRKRKCGGKERTDQSKRAAPSERKI